MNWKQALFVENGIVGIVLLGTYVLAKLLQAPFFGILFVILISLAITGAVLLACWVFIMVYDWLEN